MPRQLILSAPRHWLAVHAFSVPGGFTLDFGAV